MDNSKITTKKVKVIGTQQYINATTGELEDFQVCFVVEQVQF